MPGDVSPVTPAVAKLSGRNTRSSMVAMMISHFIIK